MSTRNIVIPLERVADGESVVTRSRIEELLGDNVEACAEAAAIWARLHYGHASYVDESLAVKSVEFSSENSGTASLSFDWTFQDGCSDICREGDGYVDVEFSISNGQLNLTWSWPEQPSTADEF
ncbi:MAG: hypothetical protein O2983_01075 [Planctomycetota bacterium]|jgi:hypothetical protein|nr:hypothetical protein [Planctomycetota bacterium]MDA0918096.1 hypothetical protein [Planctomycetota bacterium]MDA1158174.1 hypothetical protein [Planctomycetota bacterium]